MRLLVVPSPTDKWETKTEYTKLRKFLQRYGYIRIAPEVYMRIVQNRKASEKQYNNIYMVTGEADYQEKNGRGKLPHCDIEMVHRSARSFCKKDYIKGTRS